MSDLEADILLVEDSETDAELALRGLAKRGLSDRVRWLRDGEELLVHLFGSDHAPAAVERLPRLILLDLKMPRVDGLEALQRLRSDERTRTIPVVMLTSSAEEADIVRSYDLGVSSYVVKPLDFDAMMRVTSEVGAYWTMVNRVPS